MKHIKDPKTSTAVPSVSERNKEEIEAILRGVKAVLEKITEDYTIKIGRFIVRPPVYDPLGQETMIGIGIICSQINPAER